MSQGYLMPAESLRAEVVARKSRFVTNVRHAATVKDARAIIAAMPSELPGANHYVYAFRIGHGNSVIEGRSDAGEPSGTAGPPTLAVLRGSGIGDIVLVTARYFGGVKLGTGGLVRAYSDAAKTALSQLKTERKVERRAVGLEMPYAFYNIVSRTIAEHKGTALEEEFGAQVLVVARFVAADLPAFEADLRERTAGRVAAVELDSA